MAIHLAANLERAYLSNLNDGSVIVALWLHGKAQARWLFLDGNCLNPLAGSSGFFVRRNQLQALPCKNLPQLVNHGLCGSLQFKPRKKQHSNHKGQIGGHLFLEWFVANERYVIDSRSFDWIPTNLQWQASREDEIAQRVEGCYYFREYVGMQYARLADEGWLHQQIPHQNSNCRKEDVSLLREEAMELLHQEVLERFANERNALAIEAFVMHWDEELAQLAGCWKETRVFGEAGCNTNLSSVSCCDLLAHVDHPLISESKQLIVHFIDHCLPVLQANADAHNDVHELLASFNLMLSNLAHGISSALSGDNNMAAAYTRRSCWQSEQLLQQLQMLVSAHILNANPVLKSRLEQFDRKLQHLVGKLELP